MAVTVNSFCRYRRCCPHPRKQSVKIYILVSHCFKECFTWWICPVTSWYLFSKNTASKVKVRCTEHGCYTIVARLCRACWNDCIFIVISLSVSQSSRPIPYCWLQISCFISGYFLKQLLFHNYGTVYVLFAIWDSISYFYIFSNSCFTRNCSSHAVVSFDIF